MGRKLSFILIFLLGSALFYSSCSKGAEDSTAQPNAEKSSVARAVQTGKTPTLGATEPGEPKTAQKPAINSYKEASKSTAATLSPPSRTAPVDTNNVKSLPAPSVPFDKSESSKPEQVPFQPKLLQSTSNIDIILDASGSMSSPFASTSSLKFDLLKEYTLDILSQVAKQTSFPRNIGIHTFGSEQASSANNCQDVQELYKLGKLDLNKVQQALEKTTARGMSPIENALQLSAKSFPEDSTADRTIVLVADGADTCGGDPCNLAKKLKAESSKTLIHVIGFDVTPDDQAKLECIAKAADGRFFLARNENELRTVLDEAINSTVPYNLKLKVVAGATPIPTAITIFKGGTEKVIQQDTSFGTKLLRLDPGNYDILVEYKESPEGKSPSKLLKGVEVLADTKVEQSISFDLGALTISSIADDKQMVEAKYQIYKAGKAEAFATLNTKAERKSFFFTPGSYDIIAEQVSTGPEKFILKEQNIKLQVGESFEQVFRFQRGLVALKGNTTQERPLPFLFRVYPAGDSKQIVAVGAFPPEGGSIQLSPGNYDILVIGQAPDMPANPRTKITGVKVKSAETIEVNALFKMGIVNFYAQDSNQQPLATNFTVREHKSNEMLTRVEFPGQAKPLQLAIPPGTYDIIAQLKEGTHEPLPLVPLTNIKVSADKPAAAIATFVLGSLRVRGINSKEESIKTKFKIYTAGREELVIESEPTKKWFDLLLAPGNYDARAENVSIEQEEGKEADIIWIRDIKVTDTKKVSHEAIFTAGKIKIIGRGPNGKIIPCNFKIFQYGSDRELINGTSSDDWQVFDIQPGKYYLEAAYNDPEKSQLLKKWINISVGENALVEQVLRF